MHGAAAGIETGALHKVFIGHYAVGLAAKRAAPETSLGTLILSAQLLDLLWPLFLILGIEHVRIIPGITVVSPLEFSSYPFSHSLVSATGLSIVFGLLYFCFRRYKRGALIAGLCVLSHWALDALVHRPDLPVLPGGNLYVGLGLWNYVVGSVAVEFGIFLAGLAVYLRVTAAGDRRGTYGLWLFVMIVVVLWVANIFGPPPPSERAIAAAGTASWVFVFFAYWIDRHRKIDHD